MNGFKLPILLVKFEFPLKKFVHCMTTQVARFTLISDLNLQPLLVAIRALLYDYLSVLDCDFGMFLQLLFIRVKKKMLARDNSMKILPTHKCLMLPKDRTFKHLTILH
jgi:hypothetical protein